MNNFDREQYAADLKAKRWCQFVPTWERPVLTALIKAELAAGNSISVYDSEEFVLKRSTELNHIRSMLGHTGEDTLRVRNSDGDIIGHWALIYHNGSEYDPMVVISDYGWREGCEEHFEKIYRDLSNKYDV